MSDAREQNRERLPTIAKALDDFRRVFGPGVKVIYAREGEHEVGNRAAHDEADAILHQKESP